jgi:hypothetical protein
MSDLDLDDLAARAAIAAPHWDQPTWTRYLSCSPEEQALMIRIKQNSEAPAPVSAWAVAGEIFSVALQVAGVVSGVSGAVSSVGSAVQAIRQMAK